MNPLERRVTVEALESQHQRLQAELEELEKQAQDTRIRRDATFDALNEMRREKRDGI